jgi:hypothetical protein
MAGRPPPVTLQGQGRTFRSTRDAEDEIRHSPYVRSGAVRSTVRAGQLPPADRRGGTGVRSCHRTRHSGRRLPRDIWTAPVVRPRRWSAPRLVSAPVFLLGKSIALLPVVGGAAEVVQRRCALIPRRDQIGRASCRERG